MKRRIIVMGLSALVLSAVLAFVNPKPPAPKAKNVILMIGDGMGLTQISYGLLTSTERMNFERFRVMGLSRTSSSNHKITDSAAGATALSIGKKTYNGAIGVDENGFPQKTILEIAAEKGKATGMVATCVITHATPGSFIAHQSSREKYEAIAGDFMNKDINLFIGGGLDHFNKRKDSVDLTAKLKANGYEVITDMKELWNYQGAKKVAALVAPKHLKSMQEGRGDFLPRASQLAIQNLDKNKSGFFLMIEGSQIDWGGHANDAEYIRQELMDFDAAIGKVLDFAEKDGNTLVIVTADHETGGFALSGNEDDKKQNAVIPAFTTKNHTATAVPVFAYGPGAEEFMGIYQNNSIFDKMMKAFGF
jgi:alkaline phosphatase